MGDIYEFRFSSQDKMEQELDDALSDIQRDIEEDERVPARVNDLRLRQFQFVYLTMLYLTRGTDVALSYKLYKPTKTMGSISLEGKCIEIADMPRFVRAAEFASNVDIYPLVNDKVRITLTFHGLATLTE